MPLDPTIPLQVQSPQIANPMDYAVKAMTLKNLAQESQMRGQGLADDQATRQAYAQNMNPDGSQNQQGTLASLRGAGLGQKADDLQTQWAQRSAAQLQQHAAVTKQLLFSIPTDKDTPDAVKEQAWQSVAKAAAQNGLPVAQQMQQFPGYPGDSMVQHMQYISQTSEEQIAQRTKAQEMGIQKQTADAATTKAAADTAEVQNKKQQLALDSQKYAVSRTDKQNEMAQQAIQSVEAARQLPDIMQSSKDHLAATKLRLLIPPNPNDASLTQVQFANNEILKMASGNSPTTEELKSLAPINANSALATAAQAWKSKPGPANQGEFLKQYLSYANEIDNNAIKIMADKNQRIGDMKRKAMGEDNYQDFKKNYVDTSDIQTYADKHGLSLDAANKLKALRGGQ